MGQVSGLPFRSPHSRAGLQRRRSLKRRHLVWDIDKKLQEDGARPILYHNRFATCWQPQLKGLTIMTNSLFNGWRMEDVWLDR